MQNSVENLAAALINESRLCEDTLVLQLGQCRLAVFSNSEELIDHLRRYFGHVVGEPGNTDMQVIAIERDEPQLGIDFIDWKREPGKTGRKDSYADLAAARLVRKVRTGMVFLQSETHRIAAGACMQYDNQVINFINAQYMNWLQQRGWLICHAAGLVQHGHALGIAGLSGGGKSTLMLHLLEEPEIGYLTNDRLFIRREQKGIRAAGIPKLPRINPGTIVNNPRLHPLIEPEERERLLNLPKDELWEIEDKYDVMIDQLYGPGHIAPDSPLSAFLVLNWQRDSDNPLQLQQADLAQRPDLLGAIMKSPGPFMQHADGSFLKDDQPLDPEPYLALLQDIPVYEARGGIDFDTLQARVTREILR